MHTKTINFRLLLVCSIAAAVALPVALISIAKILLFLGGATIILLQKNNNPAASKASSLQCTSLVILFALFAFALSLAWTVAPTAEAFGALGKYGKLLMIPLIVLMLRSRREALYALGVFLIAQTLLLLSSWMLFFHLPVPWATSPKALVEYAVFSSYLDEGLMSAVVAALCWHLRSYFPSRFGQPFAIAMVILALGNVFFVFDGRSGHLAAISILSLAIMWKLPAKARLAVVLLPFVLLLAVSMVSPKVQSRFKKVTQEVQAFSLEKGANFGSGTSSGIRLYLWYRALQSIKESPLVGAGVGSWTSEFDRLEIAHAAKPQKTGVLGNPHQEYLLWGVQLGVPGMILFAALLLSVLRDTFAMDRKTAQTIQSVLAALAVACLFNSVIFDALIGDFFCVTLGLLLALGLHPPESTTAKPPDVGLATNA